MLLGRDYDSRSTDRQYVVEVGRLPNHLKPRLLEIQLFSAA